ncbi:MAG: cytochrome P450 [Leptolyngbyaceae cyanobacterium MO_188.B28]|nr:cytochrome P450 [Leptolyngbyaceae cyanobacterium MO_188.B28]
MTTLAPTVSEKLPPGPKIPPFIQLLNWITRPFDFMDDCRRKYGDCFTLRFSSDRPLVFFSHPKAIQTILTADPEEFDTGSTNTILLPMLGNSSVALLDGEAHRRQRQLLMPPFHGARMRSYGELICQITEQITSQWSVGQSFAVLPVTQEITLQVIMQAVFGVEEGAIFDELKPRLKEVLASTASPLKSTMLFIPQLQKDWGTWSPWGRFLQLRSRIDQLLYRLIDERRAQGDPNRSDILALLLSARDEAGQLMTDQELRDELITLLLVGHDTTASALAWAFYWIHKTPGVLNKILAELSSTSENADPTALTRLPYLTAVCQETLRIRPVAPIPFSRVTRHAFRVMDHELPPRTALLPALYLTHRRPELFPDPDQFRPERFLERQFTPYEYLPFGGGDRICIGRAFAQFEMKLALATILSRFRLKLAHQNPVKASRRGVTMAPGKNLRMVVVERV